MRVGEVLLTIKALLAGPLALSKSQLLDAFADNITAKAENHRFD